MDKLFNLTRYRKLIEKENNLISQKKAFFYENKAEFLELLDYQVIIEQQLDYNHKNDYFVLINGYLNKVITASEFKSKFLKLERQAGTEALQVSRNFQKLASFSIVQNAEPFSNLIDQIFDLYDIDQFDYEDRLSDDELHQSLKNICLQLKELFEK